MRNKILLQMACLNLLRNKKRFFLTVLAIATCTAGSYMFRGFARYTYWSLANSFTRAGNGHIQVARSEWFAAADSDNFRIAAQDLKDLEAVLKADPLIEPQLKALSLKRQISGTISGSKAHGIFTLGYGVDAEPYEKMTDWIPISDGESIDSSMPDHIVLGRGLAQRVGAEPGQSAAILVATDDGKPNATEVLVAGTAESMSQALESNYLLMPIEAALALQNSRLVDGLVIGLKNTEATDFVLERINRILRGYPIKDLAAKGWAEVSDYYLGVKNLYDRIFGFVLVTLSIVALFAVTNTVAMAVNERRAEIGMLRATGAGRSAIARLFLYEGALTGLLGGISGVGAAWALSWLIRVCGGIKMPPPPGMSQGYSLNFMLDWQGAIAGTGIAIACAALASIWPSLKAARQNIATVLAGF